MCFQALRPRLLESGEAPPHRHPGADADSASVSVLLPNREVFLELGHQPAAGDDQPEPRLQEKHVRVSSVRVHLPGLRRWLPLTATNGRVGVAARARHRTWC